MEYINTKVKNFNIDNINNYFELQPEKRRPHDWPFKPIEMGANYPKNLKNIKIKYVRDGVNT